MRKAYLKLAEGLDKLPHGYPKTDSGVEIEILEKLFEPLEAQIACELQSKSEPVSVIAERASMDLEEVKRSLKGMARKGLIRVKKGDGEMKFGLMPFVVGFYENQLPRMNTELAQLFERYFHDSRAGIVRFSPSVHRVIPVGESVSMDLEIFPYEEASEIIENAKSWGVRDCICRVQQRLIGSGCEHEVESCMVFAPVEGAFDHSEVDRAISKEEAFQILRSAAESGLVHSAANQQQGLHYICNCCTCCCGILRGLAEYDIPTAVSRSNFRAEVDEDICSSCGDCIERCQFGALTLGDDTCIVDHSRCVGCGQCTTVCSTESLHLIRLSSAEMTVPPEDLHAWMATRAKERNISI